MSATSLKHKMKSCHKGKKTYGTLQEAQLAAKMIMHKTAKSKDPRVSLLEAYGCSCGKYHIGKTGGIDWDLVKKIEERRAA